MEKKLPKGWKKKTLGEICEIQTGKYDANHAILNGKYRFYTCAFEYMFCDTNRFKGECIILPGNGANVGEVFYYNGEFDAYQRTYVLNNIKVNSKYLFYHLLGNWRRKNQDKQFGSATNYIRMGNFTDYEIPITIPENQQAIVSKIEELFSELDKGIEGLKTAQQQLKIYRQSVLKWAFEGKLTNKKVKDGVLPKDWNLYKLGEYIENISSGKSFRCDERPPNEDEIGIVKVSSVSWGFFDELQSKTCFSKDLLNEKYLIKKEDFLFSRANTIELIGACVIVHKIEKALMLSDKILRFTFTKEISKEYVLYFLRSRKGRKQIESLSTGNQDSMRNIGQEKIRQIEFPYCSVKEQYQIVQEIENRLSVADKMEESIAQSLQQAEALRQSILKKAFSGELL
jgi:type I restriction enzyme S subunit